MYTSQPCAQRAHRNPLNLHSSPNCFWTFGVRGFIFRTFGIWTLGAHFWTFGVRGFRTFGVRGFIFGRSGFGRWGPTFGRSGFLDVRGRGFSDVRGSGFHFLDVRGLDVGGPFLDVRGFLTFRGLFLAVRGFRTLGVRGSGLDPERPNPQRPKTPNVQKA